MIRFHLSARFPLANASLARSSSSFFPLVIHSSGLFLRLGGDNRLHRTDDASDYVARSAPLDEGARSFIHGCQERPAYAAV